MGPLLILYIAFASIALFACFLQLFISFRKSADMLFLVSAVLSLLLFTFFGLQIICASEIGLSCSPFKFYRYNLILTQAIAVSMIGVLYHLLSDNRRVYILLNATFFWVLILIGFILPDHVLFGEGDAFRQIASSAGDHVILLNNGMSGWRVLMDVTIGAFAIVTFLLIIKKFGAVSLRTVFILFSGLGLLVFAALWDQIADFGRTGQVYFIPFTLFLLYIILIFIPFVLFIKEILKQKMIIDQEKNWRTLFNRADIIIVGLNRMGHVEFINPYFFKLTGYEKEEVMGKDWFEFFIPPSEHYKMQGAFVEILAYEFHPHYDNPILTKNNEQKMIRWFNVRTEDISGTITGSLSVGIDVTSELKEKDKLKKKLEEAEDLILKLNEKTGKA